MVHGLESDGIDKVLPPVRQEGFGFHGETERYLAELGRSELSPALEPRRYSLRWPVDMSDGAAHIASYFHSGHYSSPRSDGMHAALDIQVPRGTLVVVPEGGVVLSVLGYEERDIPVTRGRADIKIFSPESGLLYTFGHLDPDSLPELLRRDISSRADDPAAIQLEAGTQLGGVGEFYNDYLRSHGLVGLSPEVGVPPDVEERYGRQYDHLHFEVAHRPELSGYAPLMGHVIDPLPLLQPLYPIPDTSIQ